MGGAEQPAERILTILSTLEADVLVTGRKLEQKVRELGFPGQILLAEDLAEHEICETVLKSRREAFCDVDPLYTNLLRAPPGHPKE